MKEKRLQKSLGHHKIKLSNHNSKLQAKVKRVIRDKYKDSPLKRRLRRKRGNLRA